MHASGQREGETPQLNLDGVHVTKALQLGDPIPSFEALDQHGTRVRSDDLLQRAPVVLFFYSKDETPGCTIEACGFRDAYRRFTDAGAAVVGVSDDSVESHATFAKRHGLPFTLLSDAGGAIRKAFGVTAVLGLFRGRVTFVIDRQGVVRHRFDSQLEFRRHVDEALRALSTMQPR